MPSPANGFELPHSYFSPLATKTCMKPKRCFQALTPFDCFNCTVVTHCASCQQVRTFHPCKTKPCQGNLAGHDRTQHSTAHIYRASYSIAKHSAGQDTAQSAQQGSRKDSRGIIRWQRRKTGPKQYDTVQLWRKKSKLLGVVTAAVCTLKTPGGLLP